MSRIDKIKIAEDEFILEDLWTEYIFSNIFIFLKQNNIVFLDKNEIELSGEALIGLKKAIELSLKDLLENLYKEPSQSEVQKHSTRFEKINFNNVVYRLNYRLSVSDRMAFALYKLIEFIEKGILTGFNAKLLLR